MIGFQKYRTFGVKSKYFDTNPDNTICYPETRKCRNDLYHYNFSDLLLVNNPKRQTSWATFLIL